VGCEDAPVSGARRARVLVVGTDDWAVEQASGALSAAGHETAGCHPAGEAAFPCNRFRDGGRCPVDDGVDVVADVRARATGEITPGEIGVLCGLRAGLPLVVAGIAQRGPFDGVASLVVAPGGDLGSACEDAASVIDIRTATSPAPS
jgi:hypothetical protein